MQITLYSIRSESLYSMWEYSFDSINIGFFWLATIANAGLVVLTNRYLSNTISVHEESTLADLAIFTTQFDLVHL